jgi:hypothetical protein
MYILKNEDFEEILADYSNIREVLKMESSRRSTLLAGKPEVAVLNKANVTR